jgi:hypothetical protein
MTVLRDGKKQEMEYSFLVPRGPRMTFSDYLVHLIAQYADPDYLVYQNTNHPPLSLPAELAITGEEHSYYHDGFFYCPIPYSESCLDLLHLH